MIDNLSKNNNGTLIRYFAVLFVCIQHGFMLGNQQDPFFSIGYIPIGHVGVLMFFSLSGFLLVGKIQSESLALFIANRIFRIFPVLIVVDFLTIFIGYFYSNKNLADYLNLNSLGILYRNLLFYGQGAIDGVSIGPVTDGKLNTLLNIPQWSLFYEMRSYLFLIFFSILGLLSDRKSFKILLVIFVVFGFDKTSLLHWGDQRAYEVTLIFLFGVLLRLEGMKLLPLLFFGSAIASYLSVKISNHAAYFQVATLFLICYATISISFGGFLFFQRFQKIPDVTYGVFLLHWPIALILTSVGVNSGPLIAFLSFVLASILSYPIHIFIEEPARLLPRKVYRRRMLGK